MTKEIMIDELIQIVKARLLLEFPVMSSIVTTIDHISYDDNADYIIKFNVLRNGFKVGKKFKDIFENNKQEAFTYFIYGIATIGLGLYSRSFMGNNYQLATKEIEGYELYTEYHLLFDILSYSFISRLMAKANNRGNQTTLFYLDSKQKEVLSLIASKIDNNTKDDEIVDKIILILSELDTATKKTLAYKLYNQDIHAIRASDIVAIAAMVNDSPDSIARNLNQQRIAIIPDNVKFIKSKGVFKIDGNEEEYYVEHFRPDFQKSIFVNYEGTSGDEHENAESSPCSSLTIDLWMDADDFEDYTGDIEDTLIGDYDLSSMESIFDFFDTATNIVDTSSYSPIQRFKNAFIKKTVFNYRVELTNAIDSVFQDQYSMRKLYKPGLQRNMAMPSMVSDNPYIAVFIDSSGSVSNAQVKDAVSIISAVVTNHDAYRVTFNAFTSDVRLDKEISLEYPECPDDVINDILDMCNITGGTNFASAIDYINMKLEDGEEKPDTVIIISSDGMGYFPEPDTIGELKLVFILEDDPNTKAIVKSYANLGEFLFYPKLHTN